MDLKIFESILFGNHRPWIEQNREEEKFEKIMNPKISITARSEEQFFKELYKLLELHPRILAGEPFKIEFPENKPGPIIIDLYAEENEIFEELIDINIQPSFDYKTEYYYEFIVSVGNQIIKDIGKAVMGADSFDKGKEEVIFLLSKANYLINKTQLFIKKIGYSEHESINNNSASLIKEKEINDYVLNALKTALIRIVIEIQQSFPLMVEAFFVDSRLKSESYQKLVKTFSKLEGISFKNEGSIKSFGFKFTKAEKLLELIKQLCLKFDLLNTSLTSPQQFVTLLTSSDWSLNSNPIHFNCETAQVRYIIKKMKDLFSNLTYTNIEKTGLFVSKFGNAIKAQNLYSSKLLHPKGEKEIDDIFTQFQ